MTDSDCDPLREAVYGHKCGDKMNTHGTLVLRSKSSDHQCYIYVHYVRLCVAASASYALTFLYFVTSNFDLLVRFQQVSRKIPYIRADEILRMCVQVKHNSTLMQLSSDKQRT